MAMNNVSEQKVALDLAVLQFKYAFNAYKAGERQRVNYRRAWARMATKHSKE